MPEEKMSTETEIAVIKTQISHMGESLKRIETNHLVHINDELRRINEKFDLKFGEINQSVLSLKLTDARSEPGNKLVWEVIKYVVVGIAAAGLSLLISSNI